ncbi:MAG TPA: hypothetical protein VFJ16_29680 [Longimicrobium sp.]|nr:hypothetical protein [Longimicrobium sp.]
MHKLRLDPEGLRVDTFATASTAAPAGTVRAHDKTYDYDTCLCGSAAYDTPCCTVDKPTCNGQATCLTSCNAGGPCTCPLP